MRFPPHSAINRVENVGRGAMLSGETASRPAESQEGLSSRKWRQGRDWREGSGGRRTLTGVQRRREVWEPQMQPFTALRILI